MYGPSYFSYGEVRYIRIYYVPPPEISLFVPTLITMIIITIIISYGHVCLFVFCGSGGCGKCASMHFSASFPEREDCLHHIFFSVLDLSATHTCPLLQLFSTSLRYALRNVEEPLFFCFLRSISF
ncbi:hypothetical protein, unlikely [Trypanosoma brucei gambiense DAL972]|uniref:Uncharacterized protein n=1 Tax=Trypanosoma brucei gambiense (strain MHOM/CI/86/DAL972) TaxID=679716 RepID=D0A5M8_TRYB9|nr:hypothetical protein, unlikely [Trypanosoma brucei gambiense DAL972]CBH16979.1 hypothetical protein, unlikely [Trypanosoma brucei gambiense DAL972]|eukprot:XP_011779243.1 hypothetical protein, unlikely [Trypanosoma brucei gambiense DAL972]